MRSHRTLPGQPGSSNCCDFTEDRHGRPPKIAGSMPPKTVEGAGKPSRRLGPPGAQPERSGLSGQRAGTGDEADPPAPVHDPEYHHRADRDRAQGLDVGAILTLSRCVHRGRGQGLGSRQFFVGQQGWLRPQIPLPTKISTAHRASVERVQHADRKGVTGRSSHTGPTTKASGPHFDGSSGQS